jgi:hypothetical protein
LAFLSKQPKKSVQELFQIRKAIFSGQNVLWIRESFFPDARALKPSVAYLRNIF